MAEMPMLTQTSILKSAILVGLKCLSVTVKKDGIQNVNELTPINPPEREGYVFLGWAKSEGAEEANYTFDQITEAPDGTVLYAVWRAATPEEAE